MIALQARKMGLKIEELRPEHLGDPYAASTRT